MVKQRITLDSYIFTWHLSFTYTRPSLVSMALRSSAALGALILCTLTLLALAGRPVPTNKVTEAVNFLTRIIL